MSDERRDELLQRLEDLLLAEGFSALSVDDIAASLKCSKATLYAIASSKEQLVIAVVKHFFGAAAAKIERAVELDHDPQRRITTYLTGVGTAMRRNSPAFYRDMVTFEPTARIYRRNSQTAARRVRELIEEGLAAGVLRDVHGVFAAQLVALAIDGIQSGELLESTGLSSGDAFTELSDLLLNGLSSPPVGNR